jgi:hypothetical protein
VYENTQKKEKEMVDELREEFLGKQKRRFRLHFKEVEGIRREPVVVEGRDPYSAYWLAPYALSLDSIEYWVELSIL